MPQPEQPHTILLVHCHYRLPGGEDAVFAAECAMLQAHGHRVITYERNNDAGGLAQKLLLPLRAIYSTKTVREVRALIRKEQVDLVHVHNTLLTISPSVFQACFKEHVPAVQTLHNFRIFCPNGILMRDGHVCEECPQHGLGCAVRHSCYRGSRAQSLVCAGIYAFHRLLGTYRKVNLITLTEFDRSKLLGQPVTVTIPTQNLLTPRYINGKVTRVAVSAVELTGTRYAVYQLTVEPDLWPMKRDRNLRIFQGQTVPQIVKTLLGEHQVNVEDKLTGSYRVWDYCVQYQESSLDFISRLMELEGIAYSFSHEADKHTLVLTDAATQHQPFSGYEVIPYHQTPSGGSTDEEGISQWALEDSVTPGIYSLDDYDFRKPNAWLFQAQQNPASPKPGSIDVYDWPGRFVETGHAEFYARIRQERWQVEHQQIQATATAAGIAPGHTFTLTNAPFFSDNGEYLVTAAGYHFEENRYASGEGETIHRTDFTVIPASVSYRPAQSTAWPRTYGPQTAKVVGPQGESIWTDKYGRVKVKFHWDRLAKGDDTSSCWVRVSSAWAGQGYGGVQIPRVGDEVVVDFINGDPDRPIITGRVYNDASMPP